MILQKSLVKTHIFYLYNRWVTKNPQGSDSNTDYSGSTMIATSITPIAQRHRLVHQRSTPASLGSKVVAKFQQPRFSQEEFARQNKPQLTRGVGIGTYVDHLTGDRRLETGTRESSTGLYEHTLNRDPKSEN